MKIYELDPAIWDRGRWVVPREPVRLDGEKGRCCLGFVARAEGVEVGCRTTPATCARDGIGVEVWIMLGLMTVDHKHTPLAERLMENNDDRHYDDAARVACLNAHLVDAGVDWRFALKGAAGEAATP